MSNTCRPLPLYPLYSPLKLLGVPGTICAEDALIAVSDADCRAGAGEVRVLAATDDSVEVVAVLSSVWVARAIPPATRARSAASSIY